MWGTRRSRDVKAVLERFIPTHVGNTSGRQSSGAHRPVHPHACGEHAPEGRDKAEAVGSSPRMWGTRTYVIPYCIRMRFIPTHVGNTARAASRRKTTAVHPHACGEHAVPASRPAHKAGSSPRMWGTPRHTVPRGALHRFIPTHVGNTLYQKINKNNMLCFQTKATRLISLNPVQNEPKKILPSPPAPYNFVQ